MADVKKTVQVDISVTGTNKNVLADLGKAFDGIAKSAQAASLAIGNRGFNKSLKNIKPPENLTKVADELERIAKIKLPNVKQLAEGFAGLAKIKEPPNLTRFADEAKKLNNIKVPNIKQLAQGLNMLTDSSLSMTAVGNRLRIVQRNLKRFSEINVPNIKKIAEGLIELNKVSAINVQTKSFDALSKFLTSLHGIKIPNIKQLAEAIRVLGDETLKLGAAYKNLNQIYYALKQFTSVKVPNLNALVNGLNKLTQLKVKPVTDKIKELNAALAKLDQKGHLSSFSKFASDLNQITAALKKTNQEFQNFDNTAKRAAGNMRTWGDRIKNYFQYRVVADALFAIRSAITSSWTAIKEYDQALKDLQAITGATGLEVEQMGETIRQVASTTKFSASEVAEGMRIIGQAGFSAAEAIQTMQAVSDLATGTLSSMASTVDLVTTAMRVFKIDASESASVADVFANAVNRSKLTIDKLRTSFNYVGPIARDVGVSFKETAAAMMTLANSGLRASTIGTGLRRVFAELADPSDKLRAAVRNAGLALSDIDPQTRGLREVIENLGLVISDTSIAFDLFGKRGAAAALALTDAEGQFNTMLSTVNRSGIAAQQAAKQMEGLGVQFKNLQDKLGLLAIQIGEAGITTALRAIINAARGVVDALTAVADTAFFEIIVKAGLVVAALTAITGVMSGLIALKIPAAFLAMASAIKTFGAALAFAEVKAGLLLLALNPLFLVLAGLTALTVAFFATLSDAREASEEAAKLADEYSNLSKQFRDYQENTANMKEGSEELEEANLALRDSLLKAATGMTEISDEAAEAAAAINPLTGEIDGSTEALKRYNDELNRLTLDQLVKSVQLAEENIANQTENLNRWVNRYKDAFEQIKTLAKGYGNSVIAYLELDFSKIPGIVKRTLGLTTEYGERIEKAFNFLDERTQTLFEHLIKFGEIDYRDTGENIRKYLTENLELTGLQLEGILAKVELLQKSREGQFSNIIEKWALDAKEGKETVADFVDEYVDLGGKLSKEQEKQIKDSQAQKESLVERLELEKQLLKDAIKSGADKEKAYRKYYEAEAKLLKESQELRAQDSENAATQLIVALQEAEVAYDEKTKNIRIKHKENVGLMIQELVTAEAEFNATREKLIAGVVDPKKLVADIKVQAKEIKARYETMYKEIELAVLEGRIKSREYANSRLRELEQREAQEIADLWNNTYDTINEASGPDSASAQAARKASLDAEIKQNKLRVEQEKAVLEEIAQEREDAYDRMEASREVAYKKYEANINKLVADGVISFEEGEVRKLQAELRRYEQSLMAAKSFRAGIDKLTQPEEYKSALEAELKAEEALYAARSKALEDYTKQAKTLSEQIVKDKRKLQREEQSHETKLQDIKKSNKEKLVDIEDDYTDSIRDLNYDLQDKLAALEEKRFETVQKFAAKRKALEEDYVASVNESNDSIDDLIQKLKQGDLEGQDLERTKEAYAISELAELEKRLREARKEGNEEEIKSILDRTDKIKDFYGNLADTSTAISGLERLKKFREEALTAGNELALEQIDEEEKLELEKQQKELDHVNELHKRKVSDLEEEHKESLAKQEITFNDAIDKENSRHDLAMENIRIEAAEKLKKAIEINNAINAIEAQNQGSIAPTTTTAPPAGTPTQQTPTQPQQSTGTTPLTATTSQTVQTVQAAGGAITQVLTDATQLARDSGALIERELVRPFEQFIVVTDAAGNKIITTANTMKQGFNSFGDAVSAKPLQSVKDLRTEVEGLSDLQKQGLEAPDLAAEVKPEVQNPERTKEEISDKLGTVQLPAGIKWEDIDESSIPPIDPNVAVSIPFKLKGSDEFFSEDMNFLPSDYKVTVPVEGEVKQSEQDRISDIFSGSKYSIEIDDQELNKELASVDATLTNFFDDVDARTVKIKPEIDDTEIEEIPDQEVDIALTGSGSPTLPISDKIAAIGKDIEQIGQNVKVDIEFNSDEVDDLIKKLDSIDGRTTRSTHIVRQITTGAAATGGLVADLVQRFSSGGMVFKRLADRLITQGSGFKDDVPILVKKREFVQRPEAVDYYGVPFMRALNSLSIPKFAIPGFSDGGLVGSLAESFATAASASGSAPINVSFENIVPGEPNIEATMNQMNADMLLNQLAMRKKYRS